MIRRRSVALAASLLLPWLAGCVVNPATGVSTFTGGMTTGEEVEMGRSQHPKVLESFGGVGAGAELARYVEGIGQLLARTVERRDIAYRFTVVNTPDVNAFALPGGYIYVSRGLLALADDEAQLAGVLAHELGHVTALHHARRHGQGIFASLLLGGVAAVGGGALAEAGKLGATAVLRGFSREHEREADRLGIRYMTRAGYDPAAFAEFLSKLRAHSRLAARLRGASPDEVDRFDYLATHPAPLERVTRARALAAAVTAPRPMRARDIYLDKIAGLVYGDDPAQGFVRGRVFAHPTLRLTFTAPPGFRLFNSARAVAGLGPDGARLVFDRAPGRVAGPLTAYLTDVWAKSLPLTRVGTLEINGMRAATGTARLRSRTGTVDARLVAVRGDGGAVYRFVFATPPRVTARLDVELRRATYSFRRLSAREAATLRPLRLRVHSVRAGETVSGLARRMAVGARREELFRVLNGLAPGAQPRPGQRVKIVTEGR